MGWVGTADNSGQDFIGTSIGDAREYINVICGTAIKTAIETLKQTQTVFNALENGWTGVSLQNFEINFSKGVVELEKALANAFAALVKEVAAATDAMVEQDKNMVQVQ